MTLIDTPSLDEVYREEKETENLREQIQEELKRRGETVNHPAHYNAGEYEVIEVIRDWGHAEGFCIGNAIKYLGRYKHKGKALDDLKKAAWYLDYYIKMLKGETVK